MTLNKLASKNFKNEISSRLNTIKQTEIRTIPKNWTRVLLSQIAEINPSKPKESTIDDELEVSFVPMKYVAELTGKINLSETREYGRVKNNYTYFSNGDILFAKITPCMENGKVAIADGLTNKIGFGSTEFHIIRMKNLKALNKFYFWYLISDSFRKNAQNKMTGMVGQRRVPTNYLKNVPVPFPPFNEQKRIVSEIESIFSKIDACVEATQKAIKDLELFKKSLMHKLLTKGINHTKFKKTTWSAGEQELIPESWNVIKLKDACDGKAKYGANVAAIEKDESLPRYIRITDINDDGTLRIDEWKSITEADAKEYLLQENDFLFARAGSVGKTYLYRKEDGRSAFAGYLIRFRPNSNILNLNFLFYFTHSIRYYNWVQKNKVGAVQANLNAKKYSNMPILLPPIKEQYKIASILSEVDAYMYRNMRFKKLLSLDGFKNYLSCICRLKFMVQNIFTPLSCA